MIIFIENDNYFRIGYLETQRTVIGMSFVCPGLGLYNVFPVEQNALVMQYLGEYISEDE